MQNVHTLVQKQHPAGLHIHCWHELPTHGTLASYTTDVNCCESHYVANGVCRSAGALQIHKLQRSLRNAKGKNMCVGGVPELEAAAAAEAALPLK